MQLYIQMKKHDNYYLHFLKVIKTSLNMKIADRHHTVLFARQQTAGSTYTQKKEQNYLNKV